MDPTYEELQREVARLQTENDLSRLNAVSSPLRNNNGLLWELASHLPIGLAYIEDDALIVNYWVETITGYQNENIPTKEHWFALLHGEFAEADYAHYESASEQNFPNTLEFIISTRIGIKRAITISAMRLEQRTLWVITDKTAEYEAAQARRESEHLYKTLVQGLPDGLVATHNSLITYANPALARMLGYASEQELVGKFVYDLIQPDDHAAVRTRVHAIDAGFPAALHNIQLIHKEGHLLDVQALGIRLFVKGKHGTLTVLRDISAQVKMQKQLETGNGVFVAFMNRFPALAWIKDEEENYVYGNDAWLAFMGRTLDEILQRSDRELCSPETAERNTVIEAEVRGTGIVSNTTKEAHHHEMGMRTYNVSKFPIPIGEGKTFLGGLALDVTERRQLEAQFLQAQKMESVGRLAGGVAHDFNNLLTAIIGYGDMLGDALPEKDPRHHNVDQILKAANRAAEMTRKLLAFARRQIIEPKVIAVPDLVQSLLPLLRRLIGEDVELECRSCTTPCHVKADPGQLEQVLMNLVVNARDAMPNGGRIEMEIDPETLSPEFTRHLPDISPGNYIRICVRDTGMGMTPEVLSHLFEPYFTTKGTGKGTGLGLATCHGIIKQFGGHITVYSEEAKQYLRQTLSSNLVCGIVF